MTLVWIGAGLAGLCLYLYAMHRLHRWREARVLRPHASGPRGEEPESSKRAPLSVARIGELRWNAARESYDSEPVALATLGGATCQVRFVGYDEDPSPAEFHRAIAAFLALGPDALTTAEPYVRAYAAEEVDDDFEWDEAAGELAARTREPPQDIWSAASFSMVTVERRHHGDRAVYVVVWGGCDWEEEHGLLLTFKEGAALSRVSSCDGHVTWADACDDESLEGVIYQPIGSP